MPQRIAGLVVATVVLGSLLASLLSLAARHYWLADLAVHFRLQYAVVGGLALLYYGWGRRGLPLMAAGLVVALNAPAVFEQLMPGAGMGAGAERSWPTAVAATPAARASTAVVPAPSARVADPRPLVVPASRAASSAAPLRLAALNLFFANQAHDQAIAWVRRARPEVAVFVEASPAWQLALQALEVDYPHRLAIANGPRDGLLVLSRWPLRDPQLVPGRRDLLFVTVDKPGHPLRLAAVHASWPLLPRHQAQRAADFAAIAAEARAAARAGLPYAALGDYNISPFSPHFAQLLEAGGLRSASAGRGWQPTWPTFLPPLGIQIDHALVTPDLQVTRFERGAGTGSDHRPIVVDLMMPAPAG
ncbi:MAG: endonuclease/exonuclease/phosphatase family protein [Sinobacteraceae bacterium]|nr:endonuclease/exonuclease/phosphatase family protein [Nevskiaceae bacterium]MCP5470707.1 endonuclease/exonuclease/phosphatase family protein [Nevskiaceae bacterium]